MTSQSNVRVGAPDELLKRQMEILGAANGVFLGRAFDAVTMKEVAYCAAMSRATVYKHELYGRVLLRDMERLAYGTIAAFDPA